MVLLVAAFADGHLDMEIKEGRRGIVRADAPPSHIYLPKKTTCHFQPNLTIPNLTISLSYWPAERMRLVATPESPITTPVT